MEFSLTSLKTLNLNYFTPKLTPARSTKQPLVQQWVPPKTHKNLGSITNCSKNTNYVVELELKRELEEIENQGKEWREMKNCKGETTAATEATPTLVELMECLEKEAIMGDDEGREPIDYNRRAQIFDKSSKVFQALKEFHTNSDITNTEHKNRV